MSPSFDVIHERLRAAREAAGLKQNQMAEILGISKSYVREMEKDNDPGVWKHIVGWAEATGTTTDYLLDAPWARNRERVVGTEYTPEALEAMRAIDALPKAARLFLLNAVREYASLLRALVEAQTRSTQLLLLMSELNVEADSAEAITVNPATVNEVLEQLLGRLRK